MFEHEQAAEWITEGVQLGEAQSAMGVIGMWTGALHERMDPIGKCSHPKTWNAANLDFQVLFGCGKWVSGIK